jgi:acyl-CoA thioesterase-1
MRYKNILIVLFCLSVDILLPGCDPSGNKGKDLAKPDTGNAEIKNIVFFGNSLTAGYGLDSSEAYPALIQLKIDSFHLPYKVVNAGVPGITTADGNSLVDAVLDHPVSIFNLELGGNDGLKGIEVSQISKNLQSIIEKVKRKYPSCQIVLAGMQLPANLKANYRADFKAVYPRLADTNKIYLIPFLLDGVGGVPGLTQSDGIHPNAKGEKIVAENVWKVLKPIL